MTPKNTHDIYTEYYLNQAGSGFSNIYAGPSYQKGYGIGSFLGGLFRTIYPILKKGSAVFGSELLKSGANIITDLSKNEEPQQVIKKRGKETINNLSKRVGDHMFGAGYRADGKLKRRQSSATVGSVKKQKKVTKKSSKTKKTTKKTTKKSKNKKKRSKADILDIFA